MKIDPANRGIYGAPDARDPITGKPKTDKESITAFARRHGWDVKEIKGPDDYLIEVWCSKGSERVNIWLYDRHRIASATANRIDLPSVDLRGRLEKFLAGVPCPCDPDSPENQALLPYEQRIFDPSCPIHAFKAKPQTWTKDHWPRRVEVLPDPTEVAS